MNEPTLSRSEPEVVTRPQAGIRVPRWLPAAGCGAFGLVFALPWLGFDLAWLAWINTAVLLTIVCRLRPRAAFGCAWCIGVTGHLLAHYWLAGTVQRFGQMHWTVGALALILLSVLNAVHLGVFGWLAARLARLSCGVLLIPVLWVAMEWAWPGLFPWRVGNTQLGWLPVIQSAELAGVYGVSLVVMLGAAVLWRAGAWAAGLVRPSRRSPDGPACTQPMNPRPAALAWTLGAAGLCGAALIWGDWRLSAVGEQLARSEGFQVALVQPDVARSGGRRAQCIKLSKTASPEVDLFCWPESSIGHHGAATTRFRPAGERRLKSTSANNAADGTEPTPIGDLDRPVLCAGSSFVPERPKGPFYNSAFLIDGDGTVLGVYHKRTLIPFGEYIPGATWFPPLARMSPYQVPLAAGTSSAPLVLPGVARLGVLICYEDLIARLSRDLARDGADVLVNLTNDQWFGRTLAPQQHQQLAALRAVETRRFLLRCTVTGASAVIAPTGEVTARAAVFEPAVLEAEVRPQTGLTLYVRWGDWLGWLCLAIAVAAVIVERRRSPRPAATTAASHSLPATYTSSS